MKKKLNMLAFIVGVLAAISVCADEQDPNAYPQNPPSDTQINEPSYTPPPEQPTAQPEPPAEPPVDQPQVPVNDL
jgi:hypothetical protein